MRKQIAAANWKMNLTIDKAESLLAEILNAGIKLNNDQLAVFAVPFPYLQMAQNKIGNTNNFCPAAFLYRYQIGDMVAMPVRYQDIIRFNTVYINMFRHWIRRNKRIK